MMLAGFINKQTKGRCKMKIECPKCKKEQEVNDIYIPDDACDSEEYICVHCGHMFTIGWYATLEVR